MWLLTVEIILGMLINIMSNVSSILGGLCFTVKFALLHYILYKISYCDFFVEVGLERG